MDLSFNNFTQKICSVQTDITKELLYQLENMKLYKDKSQLNNYDKTSLFDRVVYDQVFNFLNEYNLIIFCNFNLLQTIFKNFLFLNYIKIPQNDFSTLKYF